jgi:hypothetical protein
MIKRKITKKQEDFIPQLKEWLESKGAGFYLIIGKRRRNAVFFTYLLDSIERLGEYSDEDAQALNILSRNYYGEKLPNYG